jgi:hypothetical protein
MSGLDNDLAACKSAMIPFVGGEGSVMEQAQPVESSLFLDDETTERFATLVHDEGAMRAGFVAHSSVGADEADDFVEA